MKPASPLPWEHDNIEVRSDRTAHEVITDATGAIVFDSMNSDVAVIHHGDSEGPAWWDETGRADATFACHAANNHHPLLESLRRTAACLKRCAVDLSSGYYESVADEALALVAGLEAAK